MRYIVFVFVVMLLFSCTSNQHNLQNVNQNNLQNTSSRVFFKNINNGDTLQSPFRVEMGVRMMKVKPAGQLKTGTGHHHILIDKKFMNFLEVIPMDAQHLHYGKGDTVATVSLSKGHHTLTLQFADGLHRSYGEEYSNTISIYVK
tara:strand:- start:93 stop:527 length:435 start_codon:yes stop_codon:yes gene_type:complete